MDVKPLGLLNFVAPKPHRCPASHPACPMQPPCQPGLGPPCTSFSSETEPSRPPGGGKFSSRTLAGTASLGDLRLLILRAENGPQPPRGLSGAWRPPEPTRGVCMGWPPAWRGEALRRFGGIPPARHRSTDRPPAIHPRSTPGNSLPIWVDIPPELVYGGDRAGNNFCQEVREIEAPGLSERRKLCLGLVKR